MWINTFGVNDYQGLSGGLYTTLEKFRALKGLVDIFELCDGNLHLSSLNFSMIILVPSNDIGNPFVLELLSPTTSEGRGMGSSKIGYLSTIPT